MHSSSLEITDPSRSRSDLSSFITHLNPHLPEHYLPLGLSFFIFLPSCPPQFSPFHSNEKKKKNESSKESKYLPVKPLLFPSWKKISFAHPSVHPTKPPKQQPASRASYHWSSSSIHTHFVLLFPRHESLVFSWFCLMLDNSANKKQPLLQQFVSPANPK